MDTALGAIATRMTIWFAMFGYVTSAFIQLVQLRQPSSLQRLAFRFYAAGFLAFLLHVIFAFDTFYNWSHTTAWTETRNQTFAATGFNSGHGIYLNYALGIVWLIDALRWQFAQQPLHVTNRRAAVCLHGFFLFMIINGGIAFASGIVRWFAAALLIALLGAVAFRASRSTANHNG